MPDGYITGSGGMSYCNQTLFLSVRVGSGHETRGPWEKYSPGIQIPKFTRVFNNDHVQGFILLHKVLTKEKNDTTQVLFLVTASFSIPLSCKMLNQVHCSCSSLHSSEVLCRNKFTVGALLQQQVSHDALIESKEKQACEETCSL